MQEYGCFFNKYSRIRNKGDLYVPVTIRILIQISLSSYFLTDVEKLYHICQKSFITYMEKLYHICQKYKN